MPLTVKPDWDKVVDRWTETPDKVFFGMYGETPVVKIVCRERTYILPACAVSQAYRDMAIDIIDNVKGQRGILLP